MGNKNSNYNMRLLNALNHEKNNIAHDNNKSKTNRNNIYMTDKNIKNLLKTDFSLSQRTFQINLEKNTKTKKSKKIQKMTKEQRHLLKKLLNEDVKENHKSIAKNLKNIFAESRRSSKAQIRLKVNKNEGGTPKSKFFMNHQKKLSKVKIKRYGSLVNINSRKLSKFINIRNEPKNIGDKTTQAKNTKDPFPFNKNIDKLNINDDFNENSNENRLMNFTSMTRSSINSSDNVNNFKNNLTERNKKEESTTDEIYNKNSVLQRKSFRDFVENNKRRDYEECLKYINSTQVLSHLEDSDKSLLAQSIKIKKVKKDECILKMNEKINKMFFVKEGLLKCIDDKGKYILTLKPGDNYGEKEILMQKNINKLKVIPMSDCVLYSISIQSLKKMFGNKFRNFVFYNFIKTAFSRSKFFKNLSVFYTKKMFKFFNIVNLEKDNVAFPIGHVKSSKFVIIISGSLINSKNGEIIGKPLDILYEEELISLSKDKIDYALDPSPDSEVLFLEGDIGEILNYMKYNNFMEILNKNTIFENLSKIVLFKSFSQLKLYKLLELINVEKYKKGTKIITEGKIGDKFYIVKKGQVEVYQRTIYLRTLNPMEYFGERALLMNEVRSATVIAKEDVELYSLDKDSFKSNLSNMMENYLHTSLYLHDETVSLDDLLFIKELGKGNYGLVSLVMNKRTKFPYAIKAISKNRINLEKMESNIQLEKNILLKIDHPFIVKLVKCLEDKKNIYFLMEYLKGKELFDVIRDIGLLTKEQTNFFIASMLISIDYLHSRKIVYRDIKPENIVVTRNGYVKLIDFGTAKEINTRTKTIIGTPHYMAPETIMGGGYSFPVDFWSISICMYEFVCGCVPFGDKSEDPMEIYFAIINNVLEFPSDINIDKEFKHLMKKMLDKNPVYRLTNFFSIKAQPWFKDFKWDELINFNLKAPYLPIISESPFDFDEQFNPIFDTEKEKFQNYVDYIKINMEEFDLNGDHDFN